jgi:DUF4097 and DUF4098 domain-containing protein YvlB
MLRVLPAAARLLLVTAALVAAEAWPTLTTVRVVRLDRSSPDHTRRTQRTLAIPPDTAVTVEVSTGSISITGSDRSDLDIEIARTAPNASQIEQISASIDEGPVAVTISAVQRTTPRNPRLTAAVTINAPRRTRFTSVRLVDGRVSVSKLTSVIDAKSSNGDLSASELSGTIRLETTLGSLTLERARLTDGGLIRLRAFQGDVKLQLDEAPADARILATTFNGQITSKIPLQMKDGFGVRFGQATLGRGEPMISIDVVTGDIEISVK